MGAFDDLIPLARTVKPQAAPAARSGAFDDLIPGAEDAGRAMVPARQAAGPAMPMPSDAINSGLKSVLGETLGNAAGYLPPIAVMNTWADAAAREKANPDQRSGPTQMLEGFENVMRGAGQGTNPTAQPEQQVLGEIVSEDDGGTRYYRDAQGQEQPALGSNIVTLKDPATGKLMAYSRSKQSDEGGLTGASRVITQGMLTGPVTGAGRATALVNETSGAVAGERAAQGAADLQAFDRANVPVFAPAFAGAPTRMMAKGLSDTWGVGAPLQDALGNTYRGMAAEAGRIADDISPVSTFDQAGATVQRGLERFRADGVRDIEPGVLAERGIQPNAPVQPHQMMSAPARQRAADAAPIRAENAGGAAQTARGVNVPAARSLDQTYTARRGAEDMSDAEVQQLIAAPANDTSFAVRSEALYENAQRQLPPQMRANNTRNPQQFAAMNSRNAVNALRTEQEGSQIPGGIFGRYQGMADRVQTNLQIEDLRAMRTAVGRDIALLDFGRTGLDTQQLKTLYGSISRDMEIYYQDVANRAHLATRIGNNNPAHVGVDVARRADRALYEFRRADRYFRQGMQRIETFMTVMGANRPELAAQKIVQAAGEGGQGNLGMVRNALSALRPEEREAVSSLVVRQMGEPAASARGLPQETGFSPQSFVTRYNKLDARARELLFPGEHGRALDDLFRVADRVANVETFANTSNTARTAMNAGGVAAASGMMMTGGLPLALASAFGSFGTSVLLSRPAYARWATQYLTLKSQAARAPAGINAAMATQVNRLAQMAQSDPQLQQVVQHLRLSPAEVGVGQGADDNRQKENDRSAPGKGEGNQGSNSGAAPNHGGNIRGLLEPGNINLHNRPKVKNADGSISTVRSMSANIDGREVLLPTVSDDGRVMSDDEAIQQFERTGRHLGMFATPEDATAYAKKLHGDQEREYTGGGSSGGLMINPLEIAGRVKKAWDDTRQPIVERGAIAPFGKYEDGSYHLAVPGIIHDAMGDKITDEAAATRARGNLRPGEDPELGKELAGESFAKAGLAAAGGVGMTTAGKGVPDGAVGMFGGRLAKTADQAALSKAEQMAAEGAPREQIWNETGWFQGADGQWRFEIDDSNAKTSWWRKKGPLRSVLKHPDLNEAYPDVGAIPTKPNSGSSAIGAGADYQPRGEGFFGGWRQPEQIRTSSFADALDPEGKSGRLLHEAQHAVQKREGFARGASSDEYSYSDGFNDKSHPNYDHARAAIGVYADEAMRRDGLSPTRPDWKTAGDDYLRVMDEGFAWDKVRKEYETKAHDALNQRAYHQSSGEVEARNVQRRQDMTPDERRATPPWTTESVPPDQQFIQEWGQRSPIPKPRGSQAAAESADAGTALERPTIDGERVNAGFPFGRRSGGHGADEALAAVASEIESLSGRYRQLFGKNFVAPKARPGTPADEVLKGEQQTLDELRSAVSSREGALAKAPDMPTTPKIRDITGERDELMGQAKANPFVKAVPGKQGLPKKKEELDAIERFYKNGGSLPPGPWGRDPLDYQKAVREAFDDQRQQIVKLNEQKAAAKSESEVTGLRDKLKQANKDAVYLQSVINRLSKIINGGS